MEIINWKLMSHPMNWFVLFMMIFFAGIAIHLILSAFTTPVQDSTDS